MLNGRIYRAAFAPFAIALAIAAFSLNARPAPLHSTLAPDAFDGRRALSEAQRLAAEYPNLRPGGAGDERLAQRVAQTIEGLGGAAGGGFSVRTRQIGAQTIDGRQTLQTVIAQRPGATGERPIVILAHRDAAARSSAAGLSGTAALVELARVFAARETRRTVVLVSTSGGSGGDAGAADFVAHALPGAGDAAIVLGDIASTRLRTPLVVPYSDGHGSAADELQRTVTDAISHEAGVHPGAPSALGQLAHLTFALAPGEQGVLAAAGLPAVLVQSSGERPPVAGTPVSAERMEGLGRGVLNAIDALDVAPDIGSTPQTGLVLTHQIVPAMGAAPADRHAADAGRGGAARRSGSRPPPPPAVWALECVDAHLRAAVPRLRPVREPPRRARRHRGGSADPRAGRRDVSRRRRRHGGALVRGRARAVLAVRGRRSCGACTWPCVPHRRRPASTPRGSRRCRCC